jgi:hypothetical protein
MGKVREKNPLVQVNIMVSRALYEHYKRVIGIAKVMPKNRELFETGMMTEIQRYEKRQEKEAKNVSKDNFIG